LRKLINIKTKGRLIVIRKARVGIDCSGENHARFLVVTVGYDTLMLCTLCFVRCSEQNSAEPCSSPRVFQTRGHVRRYLDNSCPGAVLIQLVLEVGPRFHHHRFLGAFLLLISLKLWG